MLLIGSVPRAGTPAGLNYSLFVKLFVAGQRDAPHVGFQKRSIYLHNSEASLSGFTINLGLRLTDLGLRLVEG